MSIRARNEGLNPIVVGFGRVLDILRRRFVRTKKFPVKRDLGAGMLSFAGWKRLTPLRHGCGLELN
jgi:hypothetical protein